jgi:hypothetical protein
MAPLVSTIEIARPQEDVTVTEALASSCGGNLGWF